MTIPWLPGLTLAFANDPVAQGASLIVLAVAAMLAVYGAADPDLRSGRLRFWITYVLFVGSALAFAHAHGLFAAYVTWEAMSVCSFVLIAQRLRRDVVAAAVRALTTTRLGDLLLLVGAGAIAGGVRDVGLAFVLAGAAIKSGQLGATPWLVGAMVAPTPVSALLHSATLVAAGPYLIARIAPQLASAPNLALLLAAYAVVSAFAAALFAASSNDAKQTLAWSTSEQLSQATLASAIGLPSAAFALLAGHALAKPLLFLAAGDLRMATGSTAYAAASRKARRSSAMLAVAIVGALGLIGIPPFYSAFPLAHLWSTLVARQPATIVLAFSLSALGGWYAARFVVRLFPNADRPFAFPPTRSLVNVAAWLAIALLTMVSLVAFRFHVDLVALVLPLGALAGGGAAVVARNARAVNAGPAIEGGIARWDRAFSAPVFATACALDRADLLLLAGTASVARATFALGSAYAMFDAALDRATHAVQIRMQNVGRNAVRPVTGNISRYLAYTAGSLILAMLLAVAIGAFLRSIA